MRVNQVNTAPVQATDVKAADTKKADKLKKSSYDQAAASKTDVKSNDSAKAEISSRAKEMAQAKQVAMDTPDVRDSKIAELREKIASGKYKVDSKAVADKLVDDHLSLAGA